MGFLRARAGEVACGLCCLIATSCASTGYQYTGGSAIGIPTLVEARDQTAPRSADGTDAPRLVAQGSLTYPTWPLLQGVCGTVVVKAVIGVDGRARDAHVGNQAFNKKYVSDEGTGKPYPVAQFFDQPAVDYVMGSKFAPATVKGVPEERVVSIPLTFGNPHDAECLLR